MYLVVRALFHRRAVETAIAATRATPMDGVLIFLVVVGQIALPGVYLFSPWLDFANHNAPRSSAAVGALAWAAGLWLFWRSHADLGNN